MRRARPIASRPLVKPLHDRIGVVNGLMTTIHAYTNDQVLTDVYHEDLRRARSATMSMIPTKTGAAAALGLVLPELNGKLDGYAMRVPTINVSIVDLSFIAARDTTVEEVNAIMKAASESGPLAGLSRLQHRAAGVDRFQSRPALVDIRCDADQGVGSSGEGIGLVRQRVGVLQPNAGHDRSPSWRRSRACRVMSNPFTAHPASVGEILRPALSLRAGVRRANDAGRDSRRRSMRCCRSCSSPRQAGRSTSSTPCAIETTGACGDRS